MLRFIAARLAGTVPVVVVLSLAVFLMLHLTPGDPVQIMLGQDATPEAIVALRAELGLDQPLPIQYLRWAANALRGDLGNSIRTHEPVSNAIISRLPVTIELSIAALLISLVIGLPAGIIAATHRNGSLDLAGTGVALLGVSLPSFFLGILLILVFAQWLRWVPPSGYTPLLQDPLMNLKQMIMPALALGAALAGIVTRQMRSSLLDVLDAEFMRTARAKGLMESAVVVGHGMRNALLPVVTVIGLQVGTLLGGTILIETIFALPGVGRLAVDSIFARDFPIVQGVVLFLALVRVLSNLAADLLYGRLDPRIAHG
ncbi:MAG: ABC transporter permease [Chloroflexi bacterium]|nr:ABC transporter permease [Chloroflexota bacterium]MBV9899103.1 ABC transporter permease [Chloroflexota bacterium]